jgi:outer membrane receptor for ferrienterochelin and colicins
MPSAQLLLLILGLTQVQLPAPSAPLCAIQGVVRDSTAEVLPGVAVSVVGAPATAVTDQRGAYCIPALPIGPHVVSFVLSGFKPSSLRATVASGAPTALDLTMVPVLNTSVVVTATRTMRLLDAVPVRTEVIDRNAMQAASARTLADAVEFTTGVRVENNCQNCNFSQIRLLGLEGPYTQILVDSQPVISSLAQVYGIEHLPARMIERVEVVKGGGSALYGPGAIGGVVNIIPREARRTGGGLEARFENGASFGGGLEWASRDRETTITSFVQHDSVGARDVDDDGFTEISRRDLTAVGVRAARMALDGRARLTVDVARIGEDRRGGDQLDRAPHEAQIAEWIDSRRTSASAGWYHGIGKRLDYRVTVAAADTHRDSYYGTGQDPNAYGETSSQLGLADAQVNHYLGKHTLSWGGQVSRDRIIDAQPAYGRNLDSTAVGRGLFTQHDWTIGRGWQLLSGARVDWHSALARPVLSPRVALMISPYEALDIRVAIAQGFRAPQLFDEDLHLSSVAGDVRIIEIDPKLRDERATSMTAGVEWKPTVGPGQALFEANVFSTRLTHRFHLIERDRPETSMVEMLRTNLGGARVSGVELNAGWGIGDDLIIQGGVVAQRARFDQAEPDFGSRDFFRTPRLYGNGTVRWNTHGGWELFSGLRVTGPMKAPHYAGYIDADRLETTSSFLTVDASIGRRIKLDDRSLVITLTGRNLTDSFQPDLDRGPLRDASYVYGPRFPRSLGVGMRVEF